jgi:hypothetical protein
MPRFPRRDAIDQPTATRLTHDLRQADPPHRRWTGGRRRLAMSLVLAAMAGVGVLLGAARADAGECADLQPGWLACEDFEDGGLGWAAWFAQSPFTECNGCPDGLNDPGRIRLDHDAENAHGGEWALLMPAEASAGYTGASLTFRSCAAQKRAGCRLNGYESLHFRAWVKPAADHQYVHHFLEVAGTRPNGYWESDGNAGCRPNGVRWAGTTLDFDRNHELFFYTYFPEMRCDSGGYCSGDYVRQICAGCASKGMPCGQRQECCWGNIFRPPTPVVLPRGRWTCLELSMHLNTPGQADGSMAFRVNDRLALEQTGMHWRDVPELQLNKAWLQHYIASGDAPQSNRIWFDDVVVSTAPIGCGGPPAMPSPSASPAASATPTPRPTPEATPTPAGEPTTPPERHFVYLPLLHRR